MYKYRYPKSTGYGNVLAGTAMVKHHAHSYALRNITLASLPNPLLSKPKLEPEGVHSVEVILNQTLRPTKPELRVEIQCPAICYFGFENDLEAEERRGVCGEGGAKEILGMGTHGSIL